MKADYIPGPDEEFDNWQRQFAAQSSAINAKVQLNGQPYQVIGVMPAEFQFPSDQPDVFIPYSTIPDASIPRIREVRVLQVV